MRRWFNLFWIITVLVLADGTQAWAAAGKTAEKPKQQQVVLTSEGGLEWNSAKKTLTAEQKALVVRGDTALGADKITAYYKEGASGKDSEVYLVKAFGNVIITTPRQTVYADTAVYEIEKSVIILKGNPVNLIAGQEQMTAQILELWQNEDMAVARQHVTAQKDSRRLEAETVKAYFVKKGNATQVERFEAEDHVTITNDNETVQGDFGVYLVDKETATLRGNVKISQGKNFILGEVADINMKTGVSRLQMLPEKGKTKGQVRGVFVPDESQKGKKAVSVEKPKVPASLKEESSASGHKTNEKLLSSSDEGE
ncbi:MAG: hypothetical protein IJ752_09790 [Alphaproteobacteria bacterium]|nr:hypothetical protein [Alphaproteobacteria bacterium]